MMHPYDALVFVRSFFFSRAMYSVRSTLCGILGTRTVGWNLWQARPLWLRAAQAPPQMAGHAYETQGLASGWACREGKKVWIALPPLASSAKYAHEVGTWDPLSTLVWQPRRLLSERAPAHGLRFWATPLFSPLPLRLPALALALGWGSHIVNIRVGRRCYGVPLVGMTYDPPGFTHSSLYKGSFNARLIQPNRDFLPRL